LPKPEHVAFHASATEAEEAGFRACLRCQPNRVPARIDRRTALVADVCRHIDTLAERPRLADLAARAGISAYHLHRLFKAVTGITPAAYAAAQRAQRMRHALVGSRNVTQAIYEAGFGSSSRFYEATASTLGMTPSRYRRGGSGSEIRFTTGPCSLGHVLVASSDRGICAVLLGDDPYTLLEDLRVRYPKARLHAGGADFAHTLAAVVQLVEEPAHGLQLPLDIRGTAFQQRVWTALQGIPAGERVSYGDLARRIGQPRAVRAVARACGANLLAVAVPCHRAVDAKGGLAGYRWGLERKQVLLEREREAGSAHARAQQPAKRSNRAPTPEKIEAEEALSTPSSRRPAR
jgi:AraC family transcriptional regulator of adaptative response/methylated-DNA-[protein]-cysteine methyltransferase